MIDVIEDTKGKIRDLPINLALKNTIADAGDLAGVEWIRVTSGGQCVKGACKKRIGSQRHDLGRAADLQLWLQDRALRFTKDSELPYFTKFVEACAAKGLTGFGAGKNYMGSKTIHVGWGARAVWGAKGKASNAPGWLRDAASKGWNRIRNSPEASYIVTARSGLTLRSGPGFIYNALDVISPGTSVSVLAFDGDDGNWARTDIAGDGLVDGHLHRSFLVPLSELSPIEEIGAEDKQDMCHADI